ncbi:MAG: pilin [Candidatus Saccharimonadales bacterium]
MIQKIKTIILSASLLFAFTAPVAISSTVFAIHGGGHIVGGVCKGADKLKFEPTNTDTCTVDDSSAADPNRLIRQIINIISVIVGIVAVVMIIWGGFKYITSGGAADKVTSAKNTLLYAIIGLIIVALAQVIVRFVLRTTTQG